MIDAGGKPTLGPNPDDPAAGPVPPGPPPHPFRAYDAQEGLTTAGTAFVLYNMTRAKHVLCGEC